MNNEKRRQAAVDSYKLVDTLPEKSYDDLTRIAAYICGTPISLITMLDHDRNFLKSHYGVPFNESPRKISFCTHAIQGDDPIFLVEDAREDDRFKENPLVTGESKAIFYAGVPLMDKNDNALGTLCVFDHGPRKLDDNQKNALQALANQVVALFELHRQHMENRQLQENLIKKNTMLKDFAGVVSHDMKMPLANIIMTTDLLKMKYKELLDAQGLEYLNYLKNSSFSLSEYITGILEHYESDNLTIEQREQFDLHDMLEDIEDMLNPEYKHEVHFPEGNPVLYCNRSALKQVILNLMGNSVKYNDKEACIIHIYYSEDEDYYRMAVEDNGMGIPEGRQEEIFDLFSVVADADKNGNRGNGIGLSTVKKIIANLGGSIAVDSKMGEGTTFTFTLRKDDIPHQVAGKETVAT